MTDRATLTRRDTLLAATALAAVSASASGSPANAQQATTFPGGASYAFERGFPAPEAAQRLHDEEDFERAVQAYQFFFPTISLEAVFQGVRDAGVADNKGAIVLSGGPSHVMFTINADTPYLLATFDLKESGPMVVELPSGPFIGVINDHHFRYVADMGLKGPDAGKGGKHLVLPHDDNGSARTGYHTSRSSTNITFLGVRAVPAGGDLKAAMEAIRQVKVYPLAQSAQPPAFSFVDKTGQPFEAIPLKWEGNLQYWQKLHKVIEEEPVFEEFRPMYGLLASIGIRKGKQFAPDERMKGILERAARVGHDRLMVASFASDRQDRTVWPDRKWEWTALVYDNGDFETSSGTDIQARDRWFGQATAATQKMFDRSPNTGSLYWLAVRDQSGGYLDGSKTYKLSVPQPVPQKLFWSVTLYDPKTRSMIRTDQDKAALRSLVELKDVPKTGSTDLYFGPTAQAGKEGQWIKTNPGQGWFAYFRLYGPEPPAFDGSWKPGDFEEVRAGDGSTIGRK